MYRKLKLNIVSESVNIDTKVVNMFIAVVVHNVFLDRLVCFGWKKIPQNELKHFNPDDKWQFLAKTQSPTHIPTLSLYRIVVYSSANAAPACCTNVDFPIPTIY